MQQTVWCHQGGSWLSSPVASALHSLWMCCAAHGSSWVDGWMGRWIKNLGKKHTCLPEILSSQALLCASLHTSCRNTGYKTLSASQKEPQPVMQSSVLLLALWGRKRNVFAGSVPLACIVSVGSVAKLWKKLCSPQPLPLEWLPHTFSTPHPPNHGAMAAAAAKSQTLCDSGLFTYDHL